MHEQPALNIGLIVQNRIVARFETRTLARLLFEALQKLNPHVKDAIAIENLKGLQANGSGATATTPPYRELSRSAKDCAPPELAKPLDGDASRSRAKTKTTKANAD